MMASVATRLVLHTEGSSCLQWTHQRAQMSLTSMWCLWENIRKSKNDRQAEKWRKKKWETTLRTAKSGMKEGEAVLQTPEQIVLCSTCGHHAGAGVKCGKKGAAERSCYGLATSPIHHPSVPLVKGRLRSWEQRGEVKPVGKGVSGRKMFFKILPLFLTLQVLDNW